MAAHDWLPYAVDAGGLVGRIFMELGLSHTRTAALTIGAAVR